jgi:hypothetical protein
MGRQKSVTAVKVFVKATVDDQPHFHPQPPTQPPAANISQSKAQPSRLLHTLHRQTFPIAQVPIAQAPAGRPSRTAQVQDQFRSQQPHAALHAAVLAALPIRPLGIGRFVKLQSPICYSQKVRGRSPAFPRCGVCRRGASIFEYCTAHQSTSE